PGRALFGIAGPPGSGKTTLAERVVAAVPGAVLVGMDGFHLAHATLRALRRVERKGAPDTFDAEGYVALLHRIRDLGGDSGPLWAPAFDRGLEDAIAGSVAVPSDAPLVVTEGNYLLLEDRPWRDVAGLLDACWYVDLDDDVRRARLEARHEHYGRSPEEAWGRTLGSDERNAVLVAASRGRASAVVSLSD
ncbi:MAG: nucleoside/nucleotide kinase family protein, partial [Nocardioides sp.]